MHTGLCGSDEEAVVLDGYAGDPNDGDGCHCERLPSAVLRWWWLSAEQAFGPSFYVTSARSPGSDLKPTSSAQTRPFGAHISLKRPSGSLRPDVGAKFVVNAGHFSRR